MAGDAHGTANHTATPDTGTAGVPGAGGDRVGLTYTEVVCDLNEVVEPYACLDDRVIDRAPIDTGVGANLDAITDDQRTELRDFLPALGTTRIAETTRAEHGARLHLAIGTDHDAWANRHARDEAGAGTDHRRAAYRAARADVSAQIGRAHVRTPVPNAH